MDRKFLNIYQHVEQLYEQELYGSVKKTASLLLSACQTMSEEISNFQKRYEIWFYYADSLYHLEEYLKAESIFRKCLQVKKNGCKSKGPEKLQVENEGKLSEAEIKYKHHLCCVKLKQLEQAIAILQSIPCKQRTAKMNFALARLYHDCGMERVAISSYKEVLRDSPFALEAVQALLELGVKSVDIHALILNGASAFHNSEWLTSWIDAYASMYSKDFSEAISAFEKLNNYTVFQDNVSIIVALGTIQYWKGDYSNAWIMLDRAYSLDRNLDEGLDILAAVLYRSDKGKDISRYISDKKMVDQYTPENWILLGYHALFNKKYSRAAYFAQKACFMKPKGVEALILKGLILTQLKKHDQSILHYREAMQIAPYRFEIFSGIIENYMALKRIREACSMCSNMLKNIGKTPKALTLYASVLSKDPTQASKTKSLLEKALAEDEFYLPAVYQLAEFYEMEANPTAAIELLEKYTQIKPSGRIFQMLGDFYFRMNDDLKALEYYNFALTLEPNNQLALHGMHKIDNTSSKMDTYYMSVGEEEVIDSPYEPVPDSDQETEAENAENDDTEVLWSDMELETSSS